MVIEGIFGWPGLGQLLIQAILERDFFVVVDATVLATLFLVFGNLLADVLLYAVRPAHSGKLVCRLANYRGFALTFLIVSHGLVLLAGFFAPYDPTAQNRELPYAPPTRIHFFDEKNKFHFRPFFYRLVANAGGGGYSENRGTIYPIDLFVRGPQYSLGGLTSRRHLFGSTPSARIFLIGSDAYGRDQFSRFLYGGRISLFAGILATSVSLILGLTLGGLAGFYGSWIDEVIMRIAEIFLALPWLYLLFAVRAFLPLAITPNAVFLLLIAVMGIIGWARPARLIRGIVLSAKERDYVLAAKGFGASSLYLLRRHVLPANFQHCRSRRPRFLSPNTCWPKLCSRYLAWA